MDDVVRSDHEGAFSIQEENLAATKSLSTAPLWLALDQGGHASRALIFDSQGRQQAQAYAPITTRHISADRVEHDAEEVLNSLRTVIADIAHSLGNDVRYLQAAGLATQRSSIVCWHSLTGVALSPVLSWQDRRNNGLIDSLHGYRNEIQKITGLILSPHYGASKLRWCLDELATVKAANERKHLQCGPLSSYLLHGLLQEHPHVVDPANASRTQLWSPASGEWSAELLQWFGVPRDVLPTPVATHHRYGSLRVGNHIVPMQVCTGDQAAVPFAMGSLQSDTVYLNIGTGAFVLAALQHDIGNAAPLLRSVLYSDATNVHYALEGTVNGAGSALHWFNERSGIDVNRALPLLQRTQIKQPIPLFINGIGGVGSPYWLPNLPSTFANRENEDEFASLVAVIESIAFLITANIVLMRKHLPHLDHIVAGGGVAICPYLCECIASLTELPVQRIEEQELTAKGLAWLTAAQPERWRHYSNAVHYLPKVDVTLKARHLQWLQHMNDFN